MTVDSVLSVLDLLEGAVTAAAEAVALAADALFVAYLLAWIDDIDAGLEDWAELGRATTVALFDPQARRNVQNEECQFEGAENTLDRVNCEDGIGVVDVLFDKADPFINEHLLSMLGAPDAVGGLRQALQDLGDELDEILGPNLGSSATAPGTFVVRATAESLGSNLDRALNEGMISKRGTYTSLSSQIDAALRAHQRGQHATEHNVLGAFVNHLESQRGKSIDRATADRFIAYAEDLVSNGG